MSKQKCGSNPVAPKTLVDTTLVGGAVIGAQLINTTIAKDCKGKPVTTDTPIVTCEELSNGAAISKDPGNPITKGSDGKAYLSEKDLLAKVRKMLEELISADKGNKLELGSDSKFKVASTGEVAGLPCVGTIEDKMTWFFGLKPNTKYIHFYSTTEDYAPGQPADLPPRTSMYAMEVTTDGKGRASRGPASFMWNSRASKSVYGDITYRLIGTSIHWIDMSIPAVQAAVKGYNHPSGILGARGESVFMSRLLYEVATKQVVGWIRSVSYYYPSTNINESPR